MGLIRGCDSRLFLRFVFWTSLSLPVSTMSLSSDVSCGVRRMKAGLLLFHFGLKPLPVAAAAAAVAAAGIPKREGNTLYVVLLYVARVLHMMMSEGGKCVSSSSMDTAQC